MALYTKAELAKQSLTELIELADQHGIEFEDKPTKKAVIDELLELDEDDALIDEVDDEEDDEEEDEVDEEEEDDEEDDLELPDEDEDDEEDDVEEVKPAKKSKAKAAAKKPKAAGSDENTLAAKQVATILGTEAKTLRQFFRSEASTIEAVGSGGRYEFLETDVPKIKEEFEAWRAAHASRGRKRGEGSSTKGRGKKAVDVQEIEEVEEIEELEELDDEIDEDDLELDDEEDD